MIRSKNVSEMTMRISVIQTMISLLLCPAIQKYPDNDWLECRIRQSRQTRCGSRERPRIGPTLHQRHIARSGDTVNGVGGIVYPQREPVATCLEREIAPDQRRCLHSCCCHKRCGCSRRVSKQCRRHPVDFGVDPNVVMSCSTCSKPNTDTCQRGRYRQPISRHEIGGIGYAHTGRIGCGWVATEKRDRLR